MKIENILNLIHSQANLIKTDKTNIKIQDLISCITSWDLIPTEFKTNELILDFELIRDMHKNF